MCNEYKIIEEFFTEIENRLKPNYQEFLADAQNLYLVQHAILYPNDCNLKMVDETFQAHYQRVQKIKYISNLIYFFSLDFDKKREDCKIAFY